MKKNSFNIPKQEGLLSKISAKKSSALLFTAFLMASSPIVTAEIEKFDCLLTQSIQGGITVDLREPVYSEGILSTEQGGVIQATNIRIQAQRLRYTRKTIDGHPVWTIEGEGNLIIEFGDYIFEGEKIFYDFSTNEGEIIYGKTAVEPWFFGGERLELKNDGTTIIHNGYVTTSERDCPEWGIYSNIVKIEKEQYMKAEGVSFRAFNFTLLKIPAFRANLNAIFDSPIRYRFRWGGRQGPRLGFTYEIFSWRHWKTFFRFDYRITRGPGGGIETYYHSEDKKTRFDTISYLAKDSSILHPHEKARYRFEGVFKKLMDGDKTSILLTYDKISDKDMPSVYYDRDFDFDTAERTQLRVRRQEKEWISNFYVRARINSFQTVKEELPSLEANFKPFLLGKTGILFENYASASYLNFEYSKYLLHAHNYSSSRLQYFPSLYRPFIFGPYFTITPQVGLTAAFYGDTPKDDANALLQGRGGVEIRSQLYRIFGSVKHVIEPYINYRYYSYPTSTPHDHYIFDLSDGVTRLNYIAFGINNELIRREVQFTSSRLFAANIYSFAFFNTNKIHQTIPRIYGRFTLYPLSTVKYAMDLGWNIEHQQFDFFNFRTDWTCSEDLAIAAEYRHRGPYWWRKVDQENFFLDMFHSEKQLKHSQLSDRCDTFLLHFFYRMHPNWACEFTSRYGWDRRHEPRYCEFEVDLLTTIQTAWNVRFSYQHQQNDDRVAIFLNIGLKRPSLSNSQNKEVFCYE